MTVLGNVDGLFGRELRGWFFYENDTTDVRLIIQHKDIEVARVTCNMPRPDVGMVHEGKQSVGFVCILPLGEVYELNAISIVDERSGNTLFNENNQFKFKGEVGMSVSEDNQKFLKALVSEVLKLKKEIAEIKSEVDLQIGDITKNISSKIVVKEASKSQELYIDQSDNELHSFKINGADTVSDFFKNSKTCIVNFGIIPWFFRIQRPQHLLLNLIDKYNAPAIYINPSFIRGGLPSVEVKSISDSLIELSISIGLADYEFYSCAGDAVGLHSVSGIINKALINLIGDKSIIFAKVDHPSWAPFLNLFSYGNLIYDKMDDYAGFSNSSQTTIQYDEYLHKISTVSLCSSLTLLQSVAPMSKEILVKNGVNILDFEASLTKRSSIRLSKTPVIGYVGAVSEWFDFELLEYCAKALKDFKFIIIGNRDVEIPSFISKLKNIEFVGEIKYTEVPEKMGEFTVGIIPFKINKLINAVDPVKAYEYAAVGVPTVVTDMREVQAISRINYKSSTFEGFKNHLIEAARDAYVKKYIDMRVAYAAENTWRSRANQVVVELDKISLAPLISIVVLHYGSTTLTENCLYSIFKNTKLKFEVILVDNDRTAVNSNYIKDLVSDNKIIYIPTARNLGFAGGMNVGIRESRGDLIVLANNDIYVTDNWDRTFIRTFLSNRNLGAIGPVTNMTGNEQKMSVAYSSIDEMEKFSKILNLKKSRKTFMTDNLAFFFVAFPKIVVSKVGFLSEDFEVGYFEDDDYCKRVLAAGYELAVCDDVFIHHEHGAAFNKFTNEEKNNIFIKNKKVFERKWGQWIPHKYRREALFG
jgi:GT2 family glycosyltransferase/glycosyltransferase involved in cell wall biosynthesis